MRYPRGPSNALCAILIAGCASAGTPSNGPPPDAARGDGHPEDATPDSSVAPDSPADPCAFSGVVATWSFAGDTGSQTSTSAASTAPGFTAGDVTRSSALTAVSGTDSINSSNWTTAASRDSTKYYTFSVTPPSGCALDLTMSSVDAHSSSTGPTKAIIATSADAYAQTQTVSTTAASTPALTVTNQTQAVEVRVYGYSASGTAGTMRLQNTLTLTGALH